MFGRIGDEGETNLPLRTSTYSFQTMRTYPVTTTANATPSYRSRRLMMGRRRSRGRAESEMWLLNASEERGTNRHSGLQFAMSRVLLTAGNVRFARHGEGGSGEAGERG